MIGWFVAGMMWGFWFTCGIATAVIMDEGEGFSWRVVGRWAWLTLLGPITMIRAFLDVHEEE